MHTHETIMCQEQQLREHSIRYMEKTENSKQDPIISNHSCLQSPAATNYSSDICIYLAGVLKKIDSLSMPFDKLHLSISVVNVKQRTHVIV